MTTQFLDFDQEAREQLLATYKGFYLHGWCYSFAAGLHSLTGWTMIGLMEEDVILHAGVKDQKGQIRDIRGIVSESDFGQPYGKRPPYILREVTLEDFRAVKPVTDHEIATAIRCAELMWPDLPRTETCLRTRVERFTNDLERISRQHGFWIAGPTQIPDPYCSRHLAPKSATHSSQQTTPTPIRSVAS